MYMYLVMENIKGSLLVISLEEVSDPQHVNISVNILILTGLKIRQS